MNQLYQLNKTPKTLVMDNGGVYNIEKDKKEEYKN
jgi:hypothetical protein